MFYKRLCDQWECEADDAIAELERQQGRTFTEKQKAVFRKRGEHRFNIPDGSRWGDVKAASTNIGEVLTKAMRAVANANDELRGVFTVDWNQPAPDGSGKPLIPNEVVHALIQHFDEHDLSNKSVPPDVLGRAYEYLIKQFADDAGAKAGEFFTPPEVVDTLVRILEPRPGDTVYDPTGGSRRHAGPRGRLPARARPSRHQCPLFRPGNELGQRRHRQDQLRAARPRSRHQGRRQHHHRPAVPRRRAGQEVLARARQFPVLRRVLVAEAGAADGRQEEEGQAQEGDLRQGGLQGPLSAASGAARPFSAPPAGYGDYAFILHILASLTDDGRAGIVCPQGVLFRGQPEVEEETGEFDDDGNPKMKRRKADDEHLIR